MAVSIPMIVMAAAASAGTVHAVESSANARRQARQAANGQRQQFDAAERQRKDRITAEENRAFSKIQRQRQRAMAAANVAQTGANSSVLGGGSAAVTSAAPADGGSYKTTIGS